jgi:hypothetical protein
MYSWEREKNLASWITLLSVCVCVCVRGRACPPARISWNRWPIIVNAKLLEYTTTPYFSYVRSVTGGPGYRSWHSYWLRAWRSRNRILVGTRFSARGPPSFLCSWSRVSLPMVIWSWHGVDHPPTTSHVALRLKKVYSCTSTLPWAFMTCWRVISIFFCFFTVNNNTAELQTCEGVSSPTFGLGNGVVTYFMKLSLRILFGGAKGGGGGMWNKWLPVVRKFSYLFLW